MTVKLWKTDPQPPYTLDSLTDINTTFGGLPIQQTWSALFLLGKVIEEEDIRCVIELGKGSGALHDFFRNYCAVYSYDLPNDVFTPKIQGEIYTLIHMKFKMLVFCDDGDKPRELRTYAPFLKHGDHIMVHDYRRPNGITLSQIEQVRWRESLDWHRQQEFDDLITYIASLKKL